MGILPGPMTRCPEGRRLRGLWYASAPLWNHYGLDSRVMARLQVERERDMTYQARKEAYLDHVAKCEVCGGNSE